MDASNRGALMLVRFIAIALMGFGLIDLGFHWIESFAHHAPMQTFDFALPSICFVLGIVVLIKAGSLAEWISNRLDE
jgi:apolipoprotein N-acyltransferase